MNLTSIINLKPEQQRLLALAVAAMIAVLTLSYLASNIYQGIQLSQQQAAELTPAVMENTHRDTPDTAQLLFGQAQSSDAKALLPNTSLQLILRGAFTANDPSKATAIIESAEQTRSYRVGGIITGNTKLHGVYSDRVVLANNGQLETLYFPVLNSEAGLSQTQAIIQQQGATASQQASALSEQQRKTMIKKRLQELRAKVKAQGL